jgi:hypothetical protein
VSMPVINTAGQTLYDHVAALMADDEEYGWAGIFLCSAIGAMLQGADQIIEDDDTYPGWARLLDPAVCPAQWLPWLAWLYGVTLVPGASEAQQRATITDLPPHQRGTTAALVAAAQQYLTGARDCFVAERDGGAYRLTIVTHTSETPDPDAVLRALLDPRVKPAGLLLTYVVTAGEAWAEAVATWDGATGSWDDTDSVPI